MHRKNATVINRCCRKAAGRTLKPTGDAGGGTGCTVSRSRAGGSCNLPAETPGRHHLNPRVKADPTGEETAWQLPAQRTHLPSTSPSCNHETQSPGEGRYKTTKSLTSDQRSPECQGHDSQERLRNGLITEPPPREVYGA